jgi:hypothetical protein
MTSFIRITDLPSSSGWPRYHNLTAQAASGDNLILGIETLKGGDSERMAVILDEARARELLDFLSHWFGEAR